MKPLKLNYINYEGKRTSTTVNAQIAILWGSYHGLPPAGDVAEHRHRLTQAIQNHINAINGSLEKSAIESGLLRDIERKIIEQCERDLRQPSLI